MLSALGTRAGRRSRADGGCGLSAEGVWPVAWTRGRRRSRVEDRLAVRTDLYSVGRKLRQFRLDVLIGKKAHVVDADCRADQLDQSPLYNMCDLDIGPDGMAISHEAGRGLCLTRIRVRISVMAGTDIPPATRGAQPCPAAPAESRNLDDRSAIGCQSFSQKPAEPSRDSEWADDDRHQPPGPSRVRHRGRARRLSGPGLTETPRQDARHTR